MCLNFAGTLLATASEKGTIIRIFSTESGQPVHEVRRGAERADIYSLCFDMQAKWLACASDRSTIHIFSVDAKLEKKGAIKLSDEEAKIAVPDEEQEDEARPENKKSKFSFIKGISKYFDSEWSFARFKIPGEDSSGRYTCAFNSDGTHIIVVSSEGNYYLAQIPKTKGNCKIVDKKSLF